jgi:hypothetical protein
MTVILLGIFLALWISSTSAQQPVIELWVYTDKAYYGYGETGTLSVTVHNKGPGDMVLKNITVMFPWHGWYHETWDGNVTKTVNKAVNKGEFETYTLQVNVPSEMRNRWTKDEAEIIVKYTFGPELKTKKSTIPINIAIPVYNENITPIYYLTGVLTTAVIVVIIELYFVWRRLCKLTATPEAP